MRFASFDWPDFIAPLDPWVVLMALVLGIALGVVVVRLGMRPALNHGWFMIAAGIVFYVPLAILRSAEDSPVWERFLATLVLWAVFVIGMQIGTRQRRL